MPAESYGYPYYNRKKPKSYIMSMYQSKIESIDYQIKKLQMEKETIIAEMRRTEKIIHKDGN